MRSIYGFLTIALILFSLPSSAYVAKEGNVSASLGSFFYKTNYDASSDRPKSPYLGDFALLVQGDANDRGSLEISLFHMNKVFIRDQGGDFISEQVELMQVGLGYRWWLHHYLSVALAFYSSYAMSDPKLVHSSIPSGQPLPTSASDITEYGFDFSIQSEVWSRDRLAVILDARYARSVTSKENEHGDHYGLLVALRYFVQERDRNEK